MSAKQGEIGTDEQTKIGPHTSWRDRVNHVTVDYIVDGEEDTRHVYVW